MYGGNQRLIRQAYMVVWAQAVLGYHLASSDEDKDEPHASSDTAAMATEDATTSSSSSSASAAPPASSEAALELMARALEEEGLVGRARSLGGVGGLVARSSVSFLRRCALLNRLLFHDRRTTHPP
eukprot:2886676-Rhodomonas_salina.1